LSEQRAWQNRDERRNQNFLQLGLLQDPDVEGNVENEPDADYQEEQLARRSTWIGEHEPPLTEHATLVSEEHLGAGLILADPEEETPEVNIDERLEREGGASGVVQISLAWDDYNDLDLHLFCPSGERIYFNNKRSDCGGELDVDMNVRPVSTHLWKMSSGAMTPLSGPTKSVCISTNITESDAQSARASSGCVWSLTDEARNTLGRSNMAKPCKWWHPLLLRNQSTSNRDRASKAPLPKALQ